MSTPPYDPDKEGDPEDVRQSASISVAISNYVATAALGVLAGAVVLFTYVSGTFAVEDVFYGLIGAGVLLLVASIFVGGRGSAAVAKAVGRKEYHPNKKSEWYNWQAILTLLGLLLVIASAVAGVTVSRLHSDNDQRIRTLEREVAVLRTQSTHGQSEDTDNDRPPPSGRQWHTSWKDKHVWGAGDHHRRCW
jgi:hypothetical protein